MAKIAQLEIEITSKATGVTKALNQLIKSLEQLEAAKQALNFGNIDTSGIRNLYNHVDRLTRILRPLAEECRMISEAFSKMGATSTKAFAKLAVKTSELNEKLDEVRIKGTEANNALNNQGDSEKKVADGADKAASANRRFASSNKSVSKSSKETHKGLGSLIKQFLRLTKLKIMRQIVRNIMEGFREGMTNLYEYSRALDSMDSASFKNTMDGYATAMLQMKNSVAAAVAPVLQQLLPLIQKLVSWFVAGANAANQFFSALQGKSTYTRATDYFQEWGDAAKDTTGKVKELQRTLLGFDEINKLNDQNNGSGSGSGASTPDYSQMFEEADIGIDFSKIEKIRKLLEKIKGIFDHIWDRVKGIGTMLIDWAKSINLDPLYDSIMNLLDSIDRLIDPLFDVLETAWNNFIGPVGKYLLEDLLPKIFDAGATVIDDISKLLANTDFSALFDGMADVVTAVGDLFQPIFDIFQSLWDNFLAPTIQEGVENFAPRILKTVTDVINGIKKFIEDITPVLEPIFQIVSDVASVVGEILTTVTEIFTAINVGILEFIGDFIVNVVTPFIKDLKKMLDPVFDKLKEVFRKLGEVIVPLIEQTFKYIKKIWDLPIVQKLISGVLKDALDWIGMALDVVCGVLDFICKILDGDIPGALESLFDIGTKLFTNMVHKYIDYWGVIQKLLGKARIWVLKKFQEIVNGIMKGVATAYNSIIKYIQSCVDMFYDGFYSVVEWGAQKLNDFISMINNSGIAKAFGIHLDYVQHSFDDNAEHAKKKWHETTQSWMIDTDKQGEKFNQVMSNMISDEESALQDIDKNVKQYKSNFDGVMDAIDTTVSGVINSIPGKVKTTQTKLDKTPIQIKAEAKTAAAAAEFNKLKNTYNLTPLRFDAQAYTRDANNTLNQFWNKWNGSTFKFKAQMTGDSSTGNLLIGKKIIAMEMANGGFPDMGSLFVAGEAGAEMVGNINGRTGVASQGEITGIANAVYSTGVTEAELLREQNALLREIASKEFGGEISIGSVFNAMDRANKRAGKNLVAMG